MNSSQLSEGSFLDSPSEDAGLSDRGETSGLLGCAIPNNRSLPPGSVSTNPLLLEDNVSGARDLLGREARGRGRTDEVPPWTRLRTNGGGRGAGGRCGRGLRGVTGSS